MNVVIDFLLEYYVWILVVLVILLITVIGFLVDTKRKKKLREKADNMSANPNMDNASYPGYDNMGQGLNMGMNNMNNGYPDYNNMNMGMNNNFDMNNVNNMNAMNGMGQMNNMVNNMAPDNMMVNGMNTMDANSPINNMNTNMMNNVNNMAGPDINAMNQLNNNIPSPSMDSSSDTFFVPASEQTPKFEPRNVVIPKPVESTPIVNNMGTAPSPVVEPTPVNTEAVGMENPAGMNFVGGGSAPVNSEAPMGNAFMNANPAPNLGGAMPSAGMENPMGAMPGSVGAPNVNVMPNPTVSEPTPVAPVPPVMPEATPSVTPVVNPAPVAPMQTPLATPNPGELNNQVNPGMPNQGINNINQ